MARPHSCLARCCWRPLPSTPTPLLIERVESEPELPVRGLSMGDIEARYGAPEERLDPRGGQKSQWPVINRWVYPSFVVYFEDSRVIDVVARKAAPLETGPKPVQ
ncbi:MAG: hypothetical protein LKM39_04630 [Chiayiivirga sp.]|nr:hypothetical protein [Chiayiivirga sp.]